ncbi:1-phosphatidylinositol 3-phosphate 5-kinase-like isoform X2 [Penaeus japonicus]|uniref:1-phosphatidylinositol 3-phosphate 5-kinase-like isoform X2 n=1 Tax=Penaeus japonicus TaxID=27405 RepID=UPI001C70C443|nr:1-phosphatidylinositol 3-phosphate 5-kinase-like isoform X2 [Penaeus japonicus]
MSRSIDSPTGLTEFGPLTPDEKPQGYGFSLAKLFTRAIRGGSSKQSSSSEHQRQDQRDLFGDSGGLSEHQAVSQSNSVVDGGSGWLEKGMHDSISESSETSSMTSSVSSLVMKPASSGHDRTLPNVLTRIRNIIDNRGSTPQQYKDSDFKQYWLPDSVSRECYECEEKFTTFRRRHHCRVCGQIFCSRCCNSMIPGKIIGYTGELRVCTYCCKVVLSYLQSNNLAADVLADLRALQDELLPPTPDQSCNTQHHDAAYCSMQGSSTPSATPRGTLRRRPSLGFQEEKYAVRTRYSSGDFQVFGGQRDSDQMTAERQLLLRDSQQLHSLWSQMAGGVGGLPLASHRHRLKSFHNCFVGRDLIEWLLANDKASSRASAVAIGQALLEAGYVVCISQLEQVFVDDYVLYRPMRPSTGGSEQTAQEGLNRAQDGGQEPLWVKQITSMAESIEGEVDSNSSSKVNKEEPTHTVETPTSITSSTSNYCLDLNVKDNVVSMKKPPNVSSHGSSESDQVDARSPGMAHTSGQVPYSTTVSAVLSANAQLPFTGDAMNSTAVMSDEVLQALRGHDSSQSYARSSGWTQEEKLTQNDEECLMQQRLNAMWNSHETALLCQLLDSGGLSPSWAEVILPIVHTVTDIIRPDVKNDSDDMDIRQYVQFKKVPGGSRSECQILNGAVCTKNVADKSMATRLTDPQILLVASTIDYQRGNDNKLLALDNLLLQEADYLKNVVAKIVSYKPDIILVEKSIAFLAREYLQAHGITLVMNVKPSVMERVARCTQAEVVSSIDAQLTRPTLGMCHNFYTRSYPMPGKNKQKTLMFFDGCAMHLGCTIILRGATNAELKRVKRIMYFMVYAVYNWRLERAFLMDEYTLIPPLPSESFDLEDQVFEEELKSTAKTGSLDLEPMTKSSKSSAKKENGESTISEHGAPNRSKSLNSHREPVSSSGEVSMSSSGTSDKAKLSQTISDFSDPLHSYLNSGTSPQETPIDSAHTSLSVTEFSNTFRKALEDTIFSCSPYLKYTVPFFETEAGRNCILRKYFQKDLYFSVQLEKDKFSRKPRFSEMEVKESKDENQNVEVKSPHEFTKIKMTKEVSDKDVRAMLADFRARGGQMRNICKCEISKKELKERRHYQLSIDKDIDAKVVVEGLTSDALGSVNTTTNNTKNTINDFWSGQSGLMLTSDGRVDALHPFNHQRLSILFSSYSQASESPPAFCVNPWVLTMDFYGRNDIPLGAFLERYCFSPTYTCPSSECSVAVVDHIRKFVHDTGCVEVLLRRLDTNLDDTNAGTILMWSWCKTCREVTPMVPISLETWSLSFAKYLELRFYGGTFNRRGTLGCTHSLHHDHFQYFGYKNQVAVFKYNNITLREIALPPSKMSLCFPPITQASVVELIKGVAMQGYSAFSTILERVTSMSSECGSRWEPLLIEINKISEHQNAQRALFREKIESIQLQLTSPTLEARRLHPPTPNTTQEVTATMLAITDQVVLIKKLVAQVVSDWNAKVQDLLHLRKKEEKLEKAKVMASTSSGMTGLPRQSTSASISTSSAASAHATSSTGEMFSAPSHKQGCDTASVASSAALTGVSTESLSLSASFSELPGQEGQKNDGCEDEVDTGGAGNGESSDSPQAADVQKALGKAYVTPTVSCLMDERDHTLLALAALTTSTLSPPVSGSSALSLSSASSEILNSWENESDVSGGLQAVLPNQLTEAFSVLHRRQASDTCDGMIAGCSSTAGSPGRGHERSLSDGGQTGIIKEGIDIIGERRLAATAVKNIISTFWSSSANLMVESPFGPNEHYLLLPEVKIPVVVYGDEPSSIIAHALASQEYERQLGALKKRLKDMQKEGTNIRSSDRESQPSQEDYDSSANEESDFCVSTATTDSEKNKSAKDFHIELQWNDQHAKFYCKIFFAEHFRQLRKMVFPFGEEFYIRSLSRCIAWEARGGKSGSVFCKSHDDRFILKEMSRLEMISFLDFGPAYVQYIVNCEKEQQPTVLTRIVGVYRIGYKNTTTNKAQRMDVLVMENLFYQRNITHKFDLKGSIRNRLVNTSGKEESELVLLDENLLRMACSSPLHVRPHSKTVLSRAIAADTVFLSQQLIMDYSLLVGIDSTANQLVVGIIDYIRTFTWDKKLETIIKGSVLAGGAGKLPTVVSPEVYRTRFCHAMDRYFLLTPDRWTGLGLGIEP